jgi:hypothetical protein
MGRGKIGNTGAPYWTNGVKTVRSKISPGKDWYEGRHNKT